MASQDPEDSDKGSDAGLDMFAEPADFRPPTPPPTEARYEWPTETPAGVDTTPITMALIGSHPLWGHHLWNAAPTLSNYLVRHADQLCRGRTVLELGAAAGLPSIVAHRLGARRVIATDYPDADLMDYLQRNCARNAIPTDKAELVAQGYLWGADVAPLRAHLEPKQEHFDLLLLSDLVFNHQAHPAMLDTLDKCLPPLLSLPSSQSVDEQDPTIRFAGPQALVFFTHHRPHLAHRDMDFFTLAQQRGWTCAEVGRWTMPPMFPTDAGSEEVRSTVHGWHIYR